MSPGTRYHIIQEIGRGGVGVLYLAIDQNLQRVIALKRVRREAASNSVEEYDDKLVREARALSTLQHQHVVSVYDVGIDEEGVFVVMEYVHGESLDQAVARVALTLEDLKTVVDHTLQGMSCAHDHGLIHRDMKPANLMIDWCNEQRFNIKLVDFGLVRFVEMPTMQTVAQANAIMGTVYFMAPEQFELKAIDERTDLYSLGCVYYYCLTRKFPFEGESTAQVMSAHITGRYEPLANRRPDLPAEVVAWIERLMARDPEERPANAREALESFPANAVPKEGVPAPPYVSKLTAPPKKDDPSLALPLPIAKTGQPITNSTSRPSSASLVATSQTGNLADTQSGPTRHTGIIAATILLGFLVLGGIGAAWYLKPWKKVSLPESQQGANRELKRTLGNVVSQETMLPDESRVLRTPCAPLPRWALTALLIDPGDG